MFMCLNSCKLSNWLTVGSRQRQRVERLEKESREWRLEDFIATPSEIKLGLVVDLVLRNILLPCDKRTLYSSEGQVILNNILVFSLDPVS